jgi:hypothetical protein
MSIEIIDIVPAGPAVPGKPLEAGESAATVRDHSCGRELIPRIRGLAEITPAGGPGA